MADPSATFAINIGGDGREVSKELAAGLEGARSAAQRSQEAIKDMSASLRTLRGTSDEVKAARDRLSAALDAEKSKLSAANLAILKEGTSLQKLNEVQKAAIKAANDNAKATKGHADVVSLIGGPIDEARTRFEKLQSTFEGGITTETALLGATAGLAVGVVALGAAFIATTAAVARFVVSNADAARSLSLSREWIAGSTADSERMGDQIDKLRGKVPLTTAELSKLYETTRAGFDGTRLSGQGILDTVNAIAEASGAGATKAAGKIDEILKRGAAFGRVGIFSGFDPFSGGPGGKGELAGTGLDFSKVAANVAKQMHITVAAAELELRRGRVPIDVAAKALRDTAEQAFGGINARKLLSTDALVAHLRDNLQSLSRAVNLEPVLEEFDRLVHLTDKSTTSGYALQAIMKAVGIGLGDAAKNGGPLLETFLRTAILDATKLSIRFVQWEIELKKAGKSGFVESMRSAYDTATEIYRTVIAIGEVLGKVQAGAFETRSPAEILAAQSKAATASNLRGAEGAGPTKMLEPHARGGLVLEPPPGEVIAAVAPGEQIVPAGSGRATSAGGGGSSVQVSIGSGAVQIVVHAGVGHSAKDVAREIGASSLVADLTKALEDLLKTQGVPGPQVPR